MTRKRQLREVNLIVYTDMVCPWGFIWKRQLERAVTSLVDSHRVTVIWKPLLVNPVATGHSVEYSQFRLRHFGTVERAAEFERRVTDLGRAVGIHFEFGLIKRIPDTTRAHRLLRMTECTGHQDAIVELLFESHFIQGYDIGDANILNNIVTKVGLSGQELVAPRFTLSERRDVVRRSDEVTRRFGIRSGPVCVVDNQVGLYGPQQIETIRDAICYVSANR